MAKDKITEEQVSDWVGNYGDDNKREEWMLEVITEVANGEYDPKLLRKEILDYTRQ